MGVLLWVVLVATAAVAVETEVSYRKVLKQVERAEEMLREGRDLRRRLEDFGREIESESERGTLMSDKTPERIWLYEDSPDYYYWADRKQNDDDIEYVRADVAGAEIEHLRTIAELTKIMAGNIIRNLKDLQESAHVALTESMDAEMLAIEPVTFTTASSDTEDP
jgi:hypothetical protein